MNLDLLNMKLSNFLLIIAGGIMMIFAYLTPVTWEKYPIIYSALFFLSFPLRQSKILVFKCIGVIFILPFYLFKLLLPILDIVMLPIIYIGILYAIVVVASCHIIGESNVNLINYIAITLTSIISVLPISEKIVRKLVDKLREIDNGFFLFDKWHHPDVIKYFIYAIYFFLLVIGNICEYSNIPVPAQNTVLLKSFLTFLAFDRLIINRSILNRFSLRNFKKIFVKAFQLANETELPKEK